MQVSTRSATGSTPVGPSRVVPPSPAAAKTGVNPLIRQLNLADIEKRDTAVGTDAVEITDEPAISALAAHVRKVWSDNKLYKDKVSRRLVNCLRARQGIYSPEQIARYTEDNQGGGNMVWVPLTDVKSRAGSAWIREVVLPPGPERPFKLMPTSLPDLPESFKKAIVSRALQQAQQVLQQTAQAGGGIMGPDEFRSTVRELGEKLREDAEKTVKRIANEKAQNMEDAVADRMSEGGFDVAMDGFVEDFSTYPAALLKGPIYQRRKVLSWGPGFKPVVTDDPKQVWERVSPFDAYPAPGATDCQTGDFIERVRFRRSSLHDLKGLEGYRDDEIDKALMDYSNGRLESWMWQESERQRLEQDTLYMWLSPRGIIDALNFWGSVPGWQLISWGVSDKDGKPLEMTREYECNVLLCGNYVLYAALNSHPLGHRPYRKACYDEIPGAFWGRAIPELADTPQRMCNAIASASADNFSIASGPQVWVHTDRLAQGEDSLAVVPWRVWQLKSDPSQGVNPGIGFVQPDDRSAPLMIALEKWEIRADDATGIPRYTYGNERAGGSADTATGLSMLMNNAAKGLRRGISNIDMGVIAPSVYDTFINEMLYNPDPRNKGDCTVVPWGAAAILIKESAQQRRIQFLGMTANPIDAAILGNKGRAALLRETAQSMDFDVDVVPDDAEIDSASQSQAQAHQDQMNAELQNQLKLEQVKGSTILQREKIRSDAQAKNVDATMMSEIVKQAVLNAMQTIKPKSINFKHDEKGNLVGASAE